jgi:hypothetical protein
MYLGIHLTYLSGVSGRRLRVFNAWVASRFGTRESWVLEGELPGTEQAPADAEAQPLEPAPR